MKKYNSSIKFLIISLSISAFFCVVGIGYSNWNMSIGLSSILSTGEMNVVFDSCEIKDETYPSPEKLADAKVSDLRISHCGKNLNICIENAYPGYSATIKYSILNKGDIPVYCKLITGAEGFNLAVIDNPDYVLKANGDHGDGTFKITVPESATESTYYNLNLNLDYVQYNELW